MVAVCYVCAVFIFSVVYSVAFFFFVEFNAADQGVQFQIVLRYGELNNIVYCLKKFSFSFELNRVFATIFKPLYNLPFILDMY